MDFSDAAALAEAARRMEKYGDLPMDYADATLVLLAERLGVFDLLTLDRRGFSVYRSARGKRFTLLLDEKGKSGEPARPASGLLIGQAPLLRTGRSISPATG